MFVSLSCSTKHPCNFSTTKLLVSEDNKLAFFLSSFPPPPFFPGAKSIHTLQLGMHGGWKRPPLEQWTDRKWGVCCETARRVWWPSRCQGAQTDSQGSSAGRLSGRRFYPGLRGHLLPSKQNCWMSLSANFLLSLSLFQKYRLDCVLCVFYREVFGVWEGRKDRPRASLITADGEL